MVIDEHRSAVLRILASRARLAVDLSRFRFANVRLHECHEVADRADALEAPDCFFHFVLGLFREHGTCERCEFFFDLLIREWVPRVTFGKVELLLERSSVSGLDLHDYPLQCRKYSLDLGIRLDFDFVQLLPNLRVHDFSIVNCNGVTWRSTNAAAMT
jgi:hypothetical protein